MARSGAAARLRNSSIEWSVTCNLKRKLWEMMEELDFMCIMFKFGWLSFGWKGGGGEKACTGKFLWYQCIRERHRLESKNEVMYALDRFGYKSDCVSLLGKGPLRGAKILISSKIRAKSQPLKSKI